jgi:hypothetical protein
MILSTNAFVHSKASSLNAFPKYTSIKLSSDGKVGSRVGLGDEGL